MNKMTNTIKVWLNLSDEPVVHEQSQGYQKGLFYCVFEVKKNRAFKYPIDHIWRIEEDYPPEQQAHSD